MTRDELTARKALLERLLRARENRDGYKDNVREIRLELEKIEAELNG